MFGAFLSRDMTYSCGIFPELDKDLRVEAVGKKGFLSNGSDKKDQYEEDVDELEVAQLKKIRLVPPTTPRTDQISITADVA